MKDVQNYILEYINSESNELEDLYLLQKFLEDIKISENKDLLKEFLYLVVKISDNYHRNEVFFNRILSILSIYESKFRNFYSNYEIFNICKKNKRILLYFLQKNIIIPDKTLASIISSEKYQKSFYPFYFYPEFSSFFDKNLLQRIIQDNSEKENKEENTNEQNDFAAFDRFIEYVENSRDKFESNRNSGENELYICQLIRNDLVKEFVKYVSQTNYPLSSTIKHSIFETNSFLFDKNPTLIEYASFFGSIQVFQFLMNSQISLTPSIWNYAIHGNNSLIIHILESNHIDPPNKSYKECFIESIKCHHNNFAQYIENMLLQSTSSIMNEVDNIVIKSRNYNYIPEKSFCEFQFLYPFCEYDYISIINDLLKKKNFDLNKTKKIISN